MPTEMAPDYVARMVRCDKRINVTDTLELMRGHFVFSREMRSVISDDKSRLALFAIDKSNLL